MKKILFILLIIILSLVFIMYNNSNPRSIIANLAKKGDIHSGDLRYRVYFFGVLPFGDAVLGMQKLEDYKGEKVYHLRGEAQSLKFISKFFSSRAVIDSYVDEQKLCPILFKQKLAISGKPDAEKEVFYDQESGIMTLAGVKRQILPKTQDPLSAVFNIKRLDFDNVKDIEMNLNTNQKNYILTGNAERKNIWLNKKIYKITLLKVDIRRRDKNPYHKSSIDMVLLKADENIPILIKIFASGFLMNAKLIEIK